MSEPIQAVLAECAQLREDAAKLEAALKRVGFSVMRTSGAWTIHGVREYDKRMEEDDLRRANKIIELERELELARKGEAVLLDGVESACRHLLAITGKKLEGG